MELRELKNCIDLAIDKCQAMISENPNIILSESDFEKLLCNCISEVIKEDKLRPGDDDFSVHTQISHYFDGKSHSDIRVDILLLQESKLQFCTKHKGFKYCFDSFAIELKYLHENDTVRKVKCDFCKRKDLDNESWLYVVVLLDYSKENENKYRDKEREIKLYANELYKEKEEYKNNLFYRVLRKKVNNSIKE